MNSRTLFASIGVASFIVSAIACGDSGGGGTTDAGSSSGSSGSSDSGKGTTDATTSTDTGVPDASGGIDASKPDSGGSDGGNQEAGPNDGGTKDGGDGGKDAGPASTYSIGGTLTNVLEADLVLQNSGGDDITIPQGATSFTFPGKLLSGATYTVSVKTHPTYQKCSVSAGTGTVGAADVGSVVVDCSPKATCKALQTAFPTAVTGTYYIDLDGAGGADPFKAYCDFDFDNGGWTLIQSFTALAGPSGAVVAAEVAPGTSTYLDVVTAKAIATLSSQVHVRSTNQQATESITSTADSAPILNLRQGLLLNEGLSGAGAAAQTALWTGPLADQSHLSFSCATASSAYPSVYWACGNGNGMHLTTTHARWTWQGGNVANNVDMEVYVR